MRLMMGLVPDYAQIKPVRRIGTQRDPTGNDSRATVGLPIRLSWQPARPKTRCAGIRHAHDPQAAGRQYRHAGRCRARSAQSTPTADSATAALFAPANLPGQRGDCGSAYRCGRGLGTSNGNPELVHVSPVGRSRVLRWWLGAGSHTHEPTHPARRWARPRGQSARVPRKQLLATGSAGHLWSLQFGLGRD